MAEPNSQTIDLKTFKRTGTGMLVPSYGRFSNHLEQHVIAQLGYGMDPRAVPVEALRLMMANPAVYLAMRTLTGIVRRKDLFTVTHSDPKLVAEVYAWLPKLIPTIAAAAARAFAYGTVAVVFDWTRETLRFEVPTSTDATGKTTRSKTIADHTHYSRAVEVHPDATQAVLDPATGDPVAVNANGLTVSIERALLWIWDPEFGEIVGQAALRRGWRDYCEHTIVTVLRDKYLERSVDAPRIVKCPSGKVEPANESSVTIAAHCTALMDDLRGSGTAAFPSKREDGQPLYEVEQLEVPDRAHVWEEALNRCEANLFLAFLVAPQLTGIEDASAGAGARQLDGMLREHVEDLATWVAAGLSDVVRVVHRKNYDPAKVTAPEVVATDVGKREAKKIALEVLRMATQAAQGEVSMRTDIPALLDRLGIPVIEAPEGWERGVGFGLPDAADPATEGTANGRPEDQAGDRADRREDAATEDGEEDTGATDPVESAQEE